MLEIFINFFTIANLTILSVLLWFKKEKTNSSRFLALVVFIPGTAFLLNYLIYINFINEYPWLMLTNLAYLWAPAVVFYIRSVLGMSVNWKKALFQLVPAVVFLGSWIYFIRQGRAYTDTIFNGIFNGAFPWQFDLLNALLFMQTLIYLGYGAWLIGEKKSFFNHALYDVVKDIRHLFFSSGNQSKEYQKQWLNQFVGLLIMINVVVVFLSFLIPREMLAFIYVPLFYNFVYVLIVYKSFKYSTVLAAIEQREEARYSSSALSFTQSQECYKKIIDLITTEKLYLEPELKLEDIAKKLTISSNYISQAINQNEGKNFFEFINGFRIEEAKALLKDRTKAGFTIEAIAYDSGFGSKAAFNRAFKKHLGTTPSEYIKSFLFQSNTNS